MPSAQAEPARGARRIVAARGRRLAVGDSMVVVAAVRIHRIEERSLVEGHSLVVRSRRMGRKASDHREAAGPGPAGRLGGRRVVVQVGTRRLRD